MKNLIFITLLAIVLPSLSLKAQVTNVIVETYYVSDANDATDTTDERSIAEGSKTYRIYVELQPGSRIKKIYGDASHLLKISSTADFYNNIDRTSAYFGYKINKSWFSSNPTIALDSWFTLGLATTTKYGILKSGDTDITSVLFPNAGGTAGIPGGLLKNNDVLAGSALTSADGLTVNATPFGTWSDYGFRDNISGGVDTTVFGSLNTGSQFISDVAYLQQNNGVVGPPSDSNKVLVAQLTTTGEISFELNLVVIEPASPNPVEVSYVAKLASGEVNSDSLKVSPFLTYPQACGCRDPHYIEYNSSVACDNPGSCRTPIVYGCMDPNSCNYNPNANFNIPSLCCYPGFCNDRDIAVVCPEVTNRRMNLFPNPAKDEMTLEVSADNSEDTRYGIYDSFGTLVVERNISISSGTSKLQVGISELKPGIYMLRVFKNGSSEGKMFMKN